MRVLRHLRRPYRLGNILAVTRGDLIRLLLLDAGVAAALLLFALTGLCALYPAWLATRVFPSEALRYE